jgi:type I restriction and modification enzyme subunit R-like protein
MIHLDLLRYKDQLQIRTEQDNTRIFDPVRRRWILFQPEELVRQLFIHYCVSSKLCSINNMSVERQISVNDLHRRYDIALHNSQGEPWLLVECKAPTVPVSQKSMDQIAHYNIVLRVPYLIVTNGIDTFGCHVDFTQKSFVEIFEMPVSNNI